MAPAETTSGDTSTDKMAGQPAPGQGESSSAVSSLGTVPNSLPATSFLDSSFEIEERGLLGGDEPSAPSELLPQGGFERELEELWLQSDLSSPAKPRRPSSSFGTPQKRLVPDLRKFRSPQLVDPDESLDLEAGRLKRRRFVSPTRAASPASTPERRPAILSFDGFKTASGKEVAVSESSFAKARRSLDFLENTVPTTATPITDTPALSPRRILPPQPQAEMAASTTSDPAIAQALSRYHKMKQMIFPITRTEGEEHCIFSLFKWTWISLLPQIEALRADGGPASAQEVTDLVIDTAKERWKANYPSVLKRIAEKDEAPGVYMKLLVVKEGRESLWVTDGQYSARVSLDPLLQAIASQLTVGRVLQVIGARPLLPSPMPIDEAYSTHSAVAELRYNGTKPGLTGPLGYQRERAFVRPLAAIKLGGGLVGCIQVTFTELVKSRYLISLNGSKSIIEEEQLAATIEKVSKSIKEMNLDRESERKVYETVQVKKFDLYEVASNYHHEQAAARLTIWNPPTDCQLLHKTVLLFFLEVSPYESTSGGLSLTTTSRTIIKPVPVPK